MGRKIIIALSMCLLTSVLYAQSPAEQMNEIKQQVDKYLYGEGTMHGWQNAIDVAEQILMPYIKSWMKKNYIDVTDENLAIVENKIKHLDARRGSMCRVLAYISFTDLETLFGVTPAPTVAPTPAPQPTPQPMPQPTTQPDPQPMPQPAPQPEQQPEAVNPEPTYSNPEPYQPIVNEYGDDGVMDDLADEAIFIPTPLEQEMMEVTNAQGIQPFIKKLESQYMISRYGKYSDMPADINCYIFVYDRSMNIPAYLRKEGAIYINLQTGEMDDITNYKGCGAIWFRIKN